MINSVLNNTTQFTPISLKNMDGVKLMNRSDTKFTFSSQKLPILLEKLIPFYNVLEINGKRYILINLCILILIIENFIMIITTEG